jgi:hypothetical protein
MVIGPERNKREMGFSADPPPGHSNSHPLSIFVCVRLSIAFSVTLSRV